MWDDVLKSGEPVAYLGFQTEDKVSLAKLTQRGIGRSMFPFFRIAKTYFFAKAQGLWHDAEPLHSQFQNKYIFAVCNLWIPEYCNSNSANEYSRYVRGLLHRFDLSEK